MVDIPKFHEFCTPILEVLKDKGEISANEAVEIVVKKVGLTNEQLEVVQESNGRPVAKNRIHWACSYLKQAGGITRPKRGYINIGLNCDYFLGLGRPVTLSDLKATSEWKEREEFKAQRAIHNSKDSDLSLLSDETPEDLIDKGIKRLKSQLIDDLLEQVKGISPAAFEGLVLQVLAKMGYGGGDAKQIQGVPRGPDGGIDGKINEDKLGLDQIYIQAKRYSENSVGRPTIQSFVGAMSGGGCKKGVFVTSSTFTSDAKSFSAGLTDVRLVLIDGVRLAKLMIEHCVGVQVKETIQVAKIDQDFFIGED